MEQSTGGWKWKFLANIVAAAGEKELELLIPKSILKVNSDNFTIDFNGLIMLPWMEILCIGSIKVMLHPMAASVTELFSKLISCKEIKIL